MPQFDWPPKPLPNVTAAIRDVDSKKASFRRNAAIALRRAEGEQREPAIAALGKLVEDEDRTVRIEAISSAAALEASSLAPKIVPQLESDDPDQRVAALEFTAATAVKGDVPAVEHIIEEDDDAVVRCVALETLAALDPPTAMATCRRLLGKGDPMIPVLRTAMVILRSAGNKDDAHTLSQYIDDSRAGVSLEAASSLAHLEDARGIPRLVEEALRPAHADERVVALEGLCRTADDTVIETARKRLGSLFARRDEKMYWTGILASSGDARALERLRKQIDGKDPFRAAAAMRVAGLCSLTGLVSRLGEIADRGVGGDESALLVESIEALGQMRCAPAAEKLRAIAESAKDPDIAQHATAALEEVKRWI